jgi:hypothetical protein
VVFGDHDTTVEDVVLDEVEIGRCDAGVSPFASVRTGEQRERDQPEAVARDRQR